MAPNAAVPSRWDRLSVGVPAAAGVAALALLAYLVNRIAGAAWPQFALIGAFLGASACGAFAATLFLAGRAARLPQLPADPGQPPVPDSDFATEDASELLRLRGAVADLETEVEESRKEIVEIVQESQRILVTLVGRLDYAPAPSASPAISPASPPRPERSSSPTGESEAAFELHLSATYSWAQEPVTLAHAQSCLPGFRVSPAEWGAESGWAPRDMGAGSMPPAFLAENTKQERVWLIPNHSSFLELKGYVEVAHGTQQANRLVQAVHRLPSGRLKNGFFEAIVLGMVDLDR